MSYSAEAADQVVRMSLNGVEVAAKLTGTAAKEIAVLLYAILQDQKKTKGKTRLTSMLKSGKELKVFAVKDEDLKRFCQEAKKYGVLYCVLKDRDATDGITDVMVRAEDASKINRIFERFKLTTVDMASIKAEIMKAKEQKSAEGPVPVRTQPEISREDAFLDELMKKPEPTLNREEAYTRNPTDARITKSRQSEPSLPSKSSSRGLSERDDSRPSVRQQLKELKAEQQRKTEPRIPGEKSVQLPTQEHHAPAKKKFRLKGHDR